ncbi:MAG: hypothetical protein EA351_07035 [Gemmatimonadales bacterium]|nr:MAG: hypothetical protein EA351_07035 [Gemmatimonadales bacterium]
MNGCARGCLPLTVFVLAAATVFWFWGDQITRFAREYREPPEAAEPSPDLAVGAIEKFDVFMAADEGEVSFSAPELESVLRFGSPNRFPAGVADPSVSIRDGEVTLGVRVARELIPRLPDLEGVRQILPDTVPVHLRGRVIGIDGGDAGFVVNRLEAASIPIPSRFIPPIVDILNPEAAGDLPPEIIRITLPDGVRSVRVQGELLWLTRGH